MANVQKAFQIYEYRIFFKLNSIFRNSYFSHRFCTFIAFISLLYELFIFVFIGSLFLIFQRCTRRIFHHFFFRSLHSLPEWACFYFQIWTVAIISFIIQLIQLVRLSFHPHWKVFHVYSFLSVHLISFWFCCALFKVFRFSFQSRFSFAHFLARSALHISLHLMFNSTLRL